MRTLQERIDQAAEGSEIVLESGRFEGPLVIDRSVVLVGCDTILDGAGKDTTIQINGGEVVLRGITITGGHGRFGGAIAVDNGAEVTLLACIVTGNTAENRGGAIHVARGELYAIECVLTQNRARTGGAIYAGDNAKITFAGGAINGNEARRGGAVCACGDAEVRLDRVSLGRNTADTGDQLYGVGAQQTRPTITLARTDPYAAQTSGAPLVGAGPTQPSIRYE